MAKFISNAGYWALSDKEKNIPLWEEKKGVFETIYKWKGKIIISLSIIGSITVLVLSIIEGLPYPEMPLLEYLKYKIFIGIENHPYFSYPF